MTTASLTMDSLKGGCEQDSGPVGIREQYSSHACSRLSMHYTALLRSGSRDRLGSGARNPERHTTTKDNCSSKPPAGGTGGGGG